ncbi:hypothetical protein ABES25_05665 [Bacillus gobiensis]|uniref:hypothetical protein n=1 Tax=Bacillus gobiensis TaxID=1441095 RepID=UPI003D1953F8
MYKIGQTLIDKLRQLNLKMENENPSWNHRREKIRSILNDLKNLSNDLDDFKADVSEYQRCVLVFGIMSCHDYAEALFDQTRYLDTLETRIVSIGNRKMSDVVNTRLTLSNIFIAVFALIASIISIWVALNDKSDNLFANVFHLFLN